MSVSSELVFEVYTGDGSITDFAIPFQFIPAEASEQTKVYFVDEEGVKTLQTEGPLADYILTPDYDPVLFPAGPTTVRFAVAPPAAQSVLVARETPRLQELDYPSWGGPTKLPLLEEQLDRSVMMIQETADVASRALKLGESAAGFDGELPPPVADSVLGTNEAGTAMEWIRKADLAGGLPEDGVEFDFLEKASADQRDVRWGSGLFSGFSARYGVNLDLSGIRAALNYIFNFQYAGPLVSLSMAGSGTLREKGTSVSGPITMSAVLTRRSNDLAAVRFYEGASLLDTQTAGGGIPNGGTSTYAWNGTPFSDNKTFSVQVDDVAGDGGPTTGSASVTFSFVYPYYAGAGVPSLTAANVALLTKLVIASTASVVRTITASGGDVLYFAYPASYGALSSILDVNNFETINDWTLRTENITGLDGNAVSYRIYEFDNPVAAGSYQYTFKR